MLLIFRKTSIIGAFITVTGKSIQVYTVFFKLFQQLLSLLVKTCEEENSVLAVHCIKLWTIFQNCTWKSGHEWQTKL